MPNTETPKTPEQNEKPQKPSPETRAKKNKKSEEWLIRVSSALDKDLKKSTNRFQRELKKTADKVLDEWNRGEEAWHDAHKKRNNLTRTEQRTGAWNEADKKIDDIRKGKLNGEPRKYKPGELKLAVGIKSSPRLPIEIDTGYQR